MEAGGQEGEGRQETGEKVEVSRGEGEEGRGGRETGEGDNMEGKLEGVELWGVDGLRRVSTAVVIACRVLRRVFVEQHLCREGGQEGRERGSGAGRGEGQERRQGQEEETRDMVLVARAGRRSRKRMVITLQQLQSIWSQGSLLTGN